MYDNDPFPAGYNVPAPPVEPTPWDNFEARYRGVRVPADLVQVWESDRAGIWREGVDAGLDSQGG